MVKTTPILKPRSLLRLKGAAEDGKQENQEFKDKIQLEFDL